MTKTDVELELENAALEMRREQALALLAELQETVKQGRRQRLREMLAPHAAGGEKPKTRPKGTAKRRSAEKARRKARARNR